MSSSLVQVHKPNHLVWGSTKPRAFLDCGFLCPKEGLPPSFSELPFCFFLSFLPPLHFSWVAFSRHPRLNLILLSSSRRHSLAGSHPGLQPGTLQPEPEVEGEGERERCHLTSGNISGHDFMA